MQRIDRNIFFTLYRAKFGRLRQSQVDAINYLIDCFEQSKLINRISEFAYILATIKHETAETYEPIEELGGWYYFKYLIGKLGIKTLREANLYKGRGYVQLTGKINYAVFTNLLGIDLISFPERAQEHETAWKILEIGMYEGKFTGKDLDDYITNTKRDYWNARRIINGTDRASLIAGYADKFYDMLEWVK